MSEKDKSRFFSKIKTNTETGCREWQAARQDRGYGFFGLGGSNFGAHRIAYFLATDTDPEDLCVLHKCDNPRCVNPEHLFLGTHLDNARDRNQKGRAASGDSNGSRLHPERLARGDRHLSRTNPERLARGGNHGNSKLTEPAVASIRSMYAGGGVTLKLLAEKFGVHFSTISDVINRKIWRHVA